jgi:hypothetical protein
MQQDEVTTASNWLKETQKGHIRIATLTLLGKKPHHGARAPLLNVGWQTAPDYALGERDTDVLSVINSEDLTVFTFDRLKRRLGLHPETLSRILARLEQEGFDRSIEDCVNIRTVALKCYWNWLLHLSSHNARASNNRNALLRFDPVVFFLQNQNWRCLPNNEIGLPSSIQPYPRTYGANWFKRSDGRIFY